MAKNSSKQSNEVAQQAYRGDPGHTSARKESQSLARERIDFIRAKQHADSLGISERVSDGMRRVLLKYQTSPLIEFLDALHEEPSEAELALEEELEDDDLTPVQRTRLRHRLATERKERRLLAAQKLMPYLHSKADAGTDQAAGPDGVKPGLVAPTINLTLRYADDAAKLKAKKK